LIMLLLVLEAAAGDDVIAVAADQSVVEIRAILRVLVFVAPALSWILTYVLCRRTRARHRQREGDTSHQVCLPSMPQNHDRGSSRSMLTTDPRSRVRRLLLFYTSGLNF
jgi:hypothetical protein